MSEKGANIDLLFRNGLKDYEVLPPPGVWNSIQASGKIKSRRFMVLRVAAVITILLSLGFLTYKLSTDLLKHPVSGTVALNIPQAKPDFSSQIINQEYSPVIQTKKRSSTTTSVLPEDIVIKNIDSDLSPERVSVAGGSTGLSVADKKVIREPFKKSFTASAINPAEINYPELQYFPEEIAAAKPKNRWSIAAMASPTYYSRFATGSDEISKQLMSGEEPLMSYTGGVSFSYKLSKRLSIQSGLFYSSLGQKVDGVNSFSGFQKYDNTKGGPNFEVVTTSGTVYTSNPDVFLSTDASDRILTAYSKDVFDPKKASLQPVSNSLSQNFSYLELPVVLRYKIIDRTIALNVIGGLSYNLLVHNSVYTTIAGSKYSIGDTKGLNPLTLSSSLGMGMEYNFSDKISLNLEPTFRYYLNPFSVTSGSVVHPYSFGVFSGVSFKF